MLQTGPFFLSTYDGFFKKQTRAANSLSRVDRLSDRKSCGTAALGCARFWFCYCECPARIERTSKAPAPEARNSLAHPEGERTRAEKGG